MTTPSTNKVPGPIYAAAGAGDLAYQQLRKLPARVAELRGRVAEVRPAVAGAVTEPRLRADLDRLRELARRNAAVLRTSAQAAQERAVTVYGDLVARGQRVMGERRESAAGYRPLPPAGDIEELGTKPAQTPSPQAKAGPGEASDKPGPEAGEQ
jgi:hypothetical protein